MIETVHQYLLYAALAAGAFILLALVAAVSVWWVARGQRDRHMKLLAAMDIPEDIKAAARASFYHARDLFAEVHPFKLKAPFVMAWVVQRLAWDAENLPEKYREYDNEVGINGDRFEWIDPGNGVGIPQPIPLEKDGPRGDLAKSLCYYSKGNHPRSKWARWIWMGIRNRASMAAYRRGVEVTPELRDTHESWGDPATGKDHEGVMLHRMDDAYQLYACTKFGPFCIRTNYGFKLNNAVNYGEARAMVVCIPFSLVRWKAAD